MNSNNKSLMQINKSIYNGKSCYNNNEEEYICMGVKPYYDEKYYECTPFDYCYNCSCDPCFRCYSLIVPTGPMPPVPPVPPGPMPPVPPVPPGPVILGSAAFESRERIDDDFEFDLNLILNTGIVNQVNITTIELLANRRYSYNFEIEVEVPPGGAFNVGGELKLRRVILPESVVTTTVEQRPGVAVVSKAGIIEPDPNNRRLQLSFKSDIRALNTSMRLNIDEIA